MRHYSLSNAPFKPVNHDPALKKQVITDEGISSVKHISHISLKKGDKASAHSHELEYEVFYCIQGDLIFNIEGKPAIMTEGDCLIVEPLEEHAIAEVLSDTRLLYFHVLK